MTSLIIIHGVGNPSAADLSAATQGIAAAFPDVREADQHFVDWNAAAAARVLDGGTFRWRSVERLFGALWQAIRVGRPYASERWPDGIITRCQSVLLAINQVCFGIVIAAVVLIPTFGILSAASSSFSLEGPAIRNEWDLVDPTAFWLVPAPLLQAVLYEGAGCSLLVLRCAMLVWGTAAACLMGIPSRCLLLSDPAPRCASQFAKLRLASSG